MARYLLRYTALDRIRNSYSGRLIDRSLDTRLMRLVLLLQSFPRPTNNSLLAAL